MASTRSIRSTAGGIEAALAIDGRWARRSAVFIWTSWVSWAPETASLAATGSGAGCGEKTSEAEARTEGCSTKGEARARRAGGEEAGSGEEGWKAGIEPERSGAETVAFAEDFEALEEEKVGASERSKKGIIDSLKEEAGLVRGEIRRGGETGRGSEEEDIAGVFFEDVRFGGIREY